MSTKWSAEVLNGGVDFDDLFKDQYGILLLRGKNGFGDFIYCYLKVTIKQFKALNEVLRSNKEFTVSDYGTVIAAGKGEPPPDVREDIALIYPPTPGQTDTQLHKGPNAPPEPIEKKNWDEY